MEAARDVGLETLMVGFPVRAGSGSELPRPSGRSRWRLVKKALFSEYLLLYLIVVYLLAAAPFVPGLLSGVNIQNIVSNLLPLLLASIGQGFVLLTAGVDLSVTAVFACSSVAGGLIMSGGVGSLGGSAWALPAGLLAMVIVGIVMGVINGVSITRFKMPPFIVTLSTMTFFGGVAVWSTGSQNIYRLPALLVTIGKGSVLFIPYALVLTTAIAAIAHLILSRTVMGRWLYSVGQSAKAALISGVPINKTIVFAYVASGVCGALATVVLMGRLETASPIIGQRLLLDVIAAPVIGGVSLFGGRGKVHGIILGALFVTLMDNSLNLLGLSYFVIMMAKGGLILFAAFLDVCRTSASVSS
jgi:ribose/xylose/arabinose/galactoside ABC-type transport system permease subunit